jgi:S-adenosylmethionine/arginine decarboxylase-like enzyme
MQLEFVQTEVDDEVGGGIQLLAEWHGCKLARASLANTTALRIRCLAVVKEAGLTVCGDSFHALAEGSGIIGVVLLAESHLAIRIWPDRAVVAIDVFVCNFTNNNRARAQAVVDSLRGTFKPDKENLIQVRRGGVNFRA